MIGGVYFGEVYPAGALLVVVPPPPVPVPSTGGGDAWAGTGDRPYLPRQPKRREKPRPKPVPHEPERAKRIARQAAKAPEPLTYPPAPEIRIPDLAYPAPDALPPELPTEEPIAPDESGGTFPAAWADEAELLLLEIL